MGPGRHRSPSCGDKGPDCPVLSACSLRSMETLSDMFELDLPTVHSIISKMIINEELMVRAGRGRGRRTLREFGVEGSDLCLPPPHSGRPRWTSRHRRW